MKFPEILRQLRTSHNLTQAELAAALGRVMGKKISKSAISMYENGNRVPDFESFEAIADFFNVDINKLLGKAEYTPNEISVTEEEKQLLVTYRRIKESDKAAIKTLMTAFDKLLKIDEQAGEKKE